MKRGPGHPYGLNMKYPPQAHVSRALGSTVGTIWGGSGGKASWKK